jgi:hypothetical protein
MKPAEEVTGNWFFKKNRLTEWILLFNYLEPILAAPSVIETIQPVEEEASN